MRISDWSSDVCASDLSDRRRKAARLELPERRRKIVCLPEDALQFGAKLRGDGVWINARIPKDRAAGIRKAGAGLVERAIALHTLGRLPYFRAKHPNQPFYGRAAPTSDHRPIQVYRPNRTSVG